MKFANSYYALVFLVLILVLFSVLFFRKKQKAELSKYFSKTNILKLSESNVNPFQSVRIVLWTIALMMLILALMGPLLGERIREVKRQGVDVIIALDVSNSMNAQDVLPSRIEKAKYEIRNFVTALKGDRVGLIVFENDAFLQCPLTSDYSAINLYLDAIVTGYLPRPGTNLAAPLESATSAFERTLSIDKSESESSKNRVLVIVSDGEDNEGDYEQTIQKAKDAGVKVYSVGIGTEAGAPIPILDRSGKITDFKRDPNGNVISSKLNEVSLAKIARDTDGEYFRITSGYSDFFKINDQISKMKKTDFKSEEVVDLDNKFQYPLGLGLVLLLIEIFLLPDRRKKQEATV